MSDKYVTKMNPDIKKKWIEALESGEYQQCKSALRKDDGFCCLGVLADIYIKETGKAEWIATKEGEPFSDYYKFVGLEESNYEVLPYEVIEWAGLTQPNRNDNDELSELSEIRNVTLYNQEKFTFTLSGENDDGVGFEEIADIIRKNIE